VLFRMRGCIAGCLSHRVWQLVLIRLCLVMHLLAFCSTQQQRGGVVTYKSHLKRPLDTVVLRWVIWPTYFTLCHTSLTAADACSGVRRQDSLTSGGLLLLLVFWDCPLTHGAVS
jgi:hypothetical protein